MKDSVVETEVAPGCKGFRITHSSGAECTVSSFGAQVLSYKAPGGSDLLFSGSKTVFAPGKPIRAGIPIVFPQFGKGVLPSHGFARTSEWKPVLSSTTCASLVLRIEASSETLSVWPHQFECEYTVELSPKLSTTLKVKNRGEAPFEFYSAVHTYFAVGDIAATRVEGLHGGILIDFLKDRAESREDRNDVVISEWTDRVYKGAQNRLAIADISQQRRILIEKSGFEDAVLWNPWSEGSKGISDLAPDDYQHFICVESGNVVSPVTVAPGEMHASTQTIESASL